ncbi:(Fe-S)-binding protein [Alkalibacillus salilacus]|uniref:Glycolate oxidase iron-sulfur subunit n=1 Tax=Alkalibacillus salilacus TaxID=284582 RepID=A0ABT9VB20_9BACI|nr:(Fe-S)-binding protein [Alkalibacillus salilacus]MDQ0158131.1 glycolate oxidase iron-sulfur subunit [Alkalibacillus salilacus]
MADAALSVRIQQGFQEEVDETKLLDCMKCGFCLPACPTYVETKNEMHSPRGRISIMKAVREGDIPFDDSVEEALDLCLGCRACEPACPAGVEYGSLLESARNVISREKNPTIKERAVKHTAFEHLFKDQWKMNSLVGSIRVYQRSGMKSIVDKLQLTRVLPEILSELESVMPEIQKRQYTAQSQNSSKRNFKVAFLSGCLMNTVFSKTNDSTILLMERLGCEVVEPKGQACCGALHGHSGELESAKENAKRNIDLFLEEEVDFIVNNAGGCGAFLSEYDHLLKDDPNYKELAEEFSNKIIDISSLLSKLDLFNYTLKTKNQEQYVLTYQDSCHLRNVNRVFEEPRDILKSVHGAEYVEMKDADQCCGSAGVYNLVNDEMSMKILDRKMTHVEDTQAQIVITSNPGCLLQMKLGIKRAGLENEMKALHIVDFINDYLEIQI